MGDPTLCPFPSGLPSLSMDAPVPVLSLAIKTAFRSLLIHGNQNGAKIEKSPAKKGSQNTGLQKMRVPGKMRVRGGNAEAYLKICISMRSTKPYTVRKIWHLQSKTLKSFEHNKSWSIYIKKLFSRKSFNTFLFLKKKYFKYLCSMN